MAIYHFSVKIHSRKSGKSIIAKAAYRSGSRIIDDETGKVYDYTGKHEVVYSDIMLCKNAPDEYKDRKKLWTSVQKQEHRSDARLAREIEFALPLELSKEEQIELSRKFLQENCVDHGMCVDWSLHEKEGNPHVHALCTVRPMKRNGLWGSRSKSVYRLDENGERIPIIDPKTGEQKIGARGRKQWERMTVPSTDWDTKELLETWRKNWAYDCNRELEAKGVKDRVDHRSYKRRGINKEPTIHEGVSARHMHRRGVQSDRYEINKAIRKRNGILGSIKGAIAGITREINSLAAQQRREMLGALMEEIGLDEYSEEISR